MTAAAQPPDAKAPRRLPPTPHERTAAASAAKKKKVTGPKTVRVLNTLREFEARGVPISRSALAVAAGVSRQWIWRHPDVNAEVVAAITRQAGQEPADASAKVTALSLQADLKNAQGRAQRAESRIRVLEATLGAVYGEQAAREMGIGLTNAEDSLRERIAYLDQQALDLRSQLEEKDEELAATRNLLRQANRDANRRTTA